MEVDQEVGMTKQLSLGTVFIGAIFLAACSSATPAGEEGANENTSASSADKASGGAGTVKPGEPPTPLPPLACEVSTRGHLSLGCGTKDLYYNAALAECAKARQRLGDFSVTSVCGGGVLPLPVDPGAPKGGSASPLPTDPPACGPIETYSTAVYTCCGSKPMPTVPPGQCDPAKCQGPAPQGPTFLCSDGKTEAGPACVLHTKGATQECGWEILTCPTTPACTKAPPPGALCPGGFEQKFTCENGEWVGTCPITPACTKAPPPGALCPGGKVERKFTCVNGEWVGACP